MLQNVGLEFRTPPLCPCSRSDMLLRGHIQCPRPAQPFQIHLISAFQ